MSLPQLIVAGSSHIFALGIPETADEAETLIPLGDGPRGLFGLLAQWPRNDRYWQAVGAVSAGKVVAIFWDGNQHIGGYLIRPDRPFDFFLHERPDLDPEPGAYVVPAAALRAQMTQRFPLLAAVITELKVAGATPLVCCTPPPKGDDDFIRRSLVEAPYLNFGNQKGVDHSRLELSAPRFRLKLWLVIAQELQNLAIAHGAHYLPVPDDVMTGEGFLKPEYFANDASHANRAYGARMLDHLSDARRRI